MAKTMKRQKDQPLVRKGHTITHIILVILAVLWLIPIAFLLIASLKTKKEYNMSYIWDMPVSFGWSVNFKYLMDYSTVLQSVWTRIIDCLFSSIVSFLEVAVSLTSITTTLRIGRNVVWILQPPCVCQVSL